ncbi:hypothetical protein [Marinobacterium sedimentorum]|uniref:hypothetical protein n=1 Tax=Marinobacterium sedimentorum TaxID=2927804 RepID=UPI0020C65D35|nr:hypothetical protein [Marinobacterium sedimentorum]MCP8686192.1 hypothetical protein [Marinobacterium sedimentorum]
MAELGVIGLRVLSLLGLLIVSAALLTWLERRLLGLWQDRPKRRQIGRGLTDSIEAGGRRWLMSA